MSVMVDNKVVVRYRDGQIIKGNLTSFNPATGWVGVSHPGSGNVQLVPLSELKAIFYVRDFDGDPNHKAPKDPFGPPRYGRRTLVRFSDGEEILGYTQGIDRTRPGFFLFPADESSNNRRIYVVSTSTSRVEYARSA
jgi:hypothetical protein